MAAWDTTFFELRRVCGVATRSRKMTASVVVLSDLPMSSSSPAGGPPSADQGVLSTDLPANTALLAPRIWVNNGATAAAVAIDVASQYLDLPF